MEDYQATTDAELQAKYQQQIEALEAEIEAQEAIEAAANKVALRLKEAKDNSD
jgi:hypothetical protein